MMGWNKPTWSNPAADIKSVANKASGFDNVIEGDFSFAGMGGKSGKLGEADVVGATLDKSNPYLNASKAAKEKARKDAEKAQQHYEQTMAMNPRYDTADQAYKDAFTAASGTYLENAKKLTGDYTSKIDQLDAMAKNQANNHQAVYTNTILPGYMEAMEMQQKNAAGAMTLEEAMDPNNKLAVAIRDMYDKQGQKARMQGQQDYGILSALGAQAAQGQFGMSGPMTAGAMGQIYAQNQNQAGDAYARAQQRMYNLQQQGIDRGFDDTKFWYQQGQGARDAYGKSIQDLQAGENSFYDQQGRFRDEIGGYAGDILGVNSALGADIYNMGMTGAGIDKGNAYAGLGREQGALNQLYGAQQTAADAEMAAKLANYNNQAQFLSSLAGMFSSTGWGKAAGGAAAQKAG